MHCCQFEDDIPFHILNDPCLSQERRAELDAHMTACPKCREIYEETQWIIQTLREGKERMNEANRLRKQQEENVALDRMTDEEFAEAVANMEPVVEPPEVVEAGWQRLKARFEEMDEEKRKRCATRVVLFRRAAAIAACALVVVGLSLLAMKMVLTPGEVTLEVETSEQKIPFGEEIRTSFVERKTLHLGGKHRVVANSGTAFTVTSLRQGLKTGYLLSLKTGELYVEVTHDGNPFTVRTPHAEAVITGTRFNIRTMPGHTQLALADGSVRFSAAGESVIVRTGQVSTVAAGSPPTRPLSVDTAAMTAWAREKIVRDSVARRSPVVDTSFMDSMIENMRYPDPPDPAKLDYATWRDKNREWFQQQFPWIFKVQDALKAERDVETDYIELLMLSGDIWQFHYPRPFDKPIPLFDSSAIERLANHHGLDAQWLLRVAQPSAVTGEAAASVRQGDKTPGEMYRAALETWRADVAAAEKRWDEEFPSDLLFFSIGASRYLADTRTAAYLWAREHREQAGKMLACPVCAPVVAAFFPSLVRLGEAGMSEGDVEAFLAALSEQSVSAGNAKNRSLEQLGKPAPEKDGCRCRCDMPQPEISKALTALVE